MPREGFSTSMGCVDALYFFQEVHVHHVQHLNFLQAGAFLISVAEILSHFGEDTDFMGPGPTHAGLGRPWSDSDANHCFSFQHLKLIAAFLNAAARLGSGCLKFRVGNDEVPVTDRDASASEHRDCQ
jgi:hypothetical protein